MAGASQWRGRQPCAAPCMQQADAQWWQCSVRTSATSRLHQRLRAMHICGDGPTHPLPLQLAPGQQGDAQQRAGGHSAGAGARLPLENALSLQVQRLRRSLARPCFPPAALISSCHTVTPTEPTQPYKAGIGHMAGPCACSSRHHICHTRAVYDRRRCHSVWLFHCS